MFGDGRSDVEYFEHAQRRPGQRGVFEQTDELSNLGGDNVAQCLRQGNQERHLGGIEAQCFTGLSLAFGHRLQATTNNFCHIRCGKEGEDRDRTEDWARGQVNRDEEL